MFLDTVSLQKNTMMFKWDQMLIVENQGYGTVSTSCQLVLICLYKTVLLPLLEKTLRIYKN